MSDTNITINISGGAPSGKELFMTTRGLIESGGSLFAYTPSKPEPFTITKEQYDKDIAQAKKDAFESAKAWALNSAKQEPKPSPKKFAFVDGEANTAHEIYISTLVELGCFHHTWNKMPDYIAMTSDQIRVLLHSKS